MRLHTLSLALFTLAACDTAGKPTDAGSSDAGSAVDVGRDVFDASPADAALDAPFRGTDGGAGPPCDPSDAGPGYDASWYGGATPSPDASLVGLSCTTGSLEAYGCLAFFPDAGVRPGCLDVATSAGWVTEGARVPVTLACDPVDAGAVSPAIALLVSAVPRETYSCYPLDILVEIDGAPTTEVYQQLLQSPYQEQLPAAAGLPLLDDYENVPATLDIRFAGVEQRFHVLLDDPRH